MARLINADAYLDKVCTYKTTGCGSCKFQTVCPADEPTVEAIPIELYEQIKGERDVAIEQLKSLNIELFEKPYLKAIPTDYIEAFKKEFRAVASVKAVIEWLLEKWEKENEPNKKNTSQTD